MWISLIFVFRKKKVVNFLTNSLEKKEWCEWRTIPIHSEITIS